MGEAAAVAVVAVGKWAVLSCPLFHSLRGIFRDTVRKDKQERVIVLVRFLARGSPFCGRVGGSYRRG